MDHFQGPKTMEQQPPTSTQPSSTPPPAAPKTNNPFDNQKPIPGVKRIIAVGSGKGGVGKSSLTLALAEGLKKKYDWKVGILDADIYGPSLPRLTGTLHQKLEVNADNQLVPIKRHGFQLVSIGHLVDEDAAVVWRGPMLFKAIQQFLFDVNWGELDCLLIDLPPGTGDVALTLAQKTKIDGAIVISTPQNMSLSDARKAINMFEQINIPLLGMIENMSYMIGPNNEKLDVFPKGQLKSFLETHKIPLLSSIPLDPSFALSCEAGLPSVPKELSNSLEVLKTKLL